MMTKEENRAKVKAWRLANPDKESERKRKWEANNRIKEKKRVAKWRNENFDKTMIQYAVRYFKKNGLLKTPNHLIEGKLECIKLVRALKSKTAEIYQTTIIKN